MFGNWHYCNALSASCIEFAQHREKIGGCLCHIFGSAQVSHDCGMGYVRAEREQRFLQVCILCVEPQCRARGVVAGKLPWRDYVSALRRAEFSCNALDIFSRNRPQSQQHGTLAFETDDSRFNTPRRRSTVEHKLHAVSQVARHMCRGCGADMARAVGAWR